MLHGTINTTGGVLVNNPYPGTNCQIRIMSFAFTVVTTATVTIGDTSGQNQEVYSFGSNGGGINRTTGTEEPLFDCKPGDNFQIGSGGVAVTGGYNYVIIGPTGPDAIDKQLGV